MATATRTATLDDVLQPKPTSIDLDAHRADMARRAAERAAKRQLLDDCTNPLVAAKYELEKPHYRWTIKAKWIDARNEYHAEETVVGQNEADAWARFCDRLQTWPSRRNCRELSIAKGKKVELSEVERCIRAEGDDDDTGPRTVVHLSAKKKQPAK